MVMAHTHTNIAILTGKWYNFKYIPEGLIIGLKKNYWLLTNNNIRIPIFGTPFPPQKSRVWAERKNLKKCYRRGYCFRGAVELCRNVNQKISGCVNGGQIGGSQVHRPGSKGPHRPDWKFVMKCFRAKRADFEKGILARFQDDSFCKISNQTQ